MDSVDRNKNRRFVPGSLEMSEGNVGGGKKFFVKAVLRGSVLWAGPWGESSTGGQKERRARGGKKKPMGSARWQGFKEQWVFLKWREYIFTMNRDET